MQATKQCAEQSKAHSVTVHQAKHCKQQKYAALTEHITIARHSDTRPLIRGADELHHSRGVTTHLGQDRSYCTQSDIRLPNLCISVQSLQFRSEHFMMICEISLDPSQKVVVSGKLGKEHTLVRISFWYRQCWKVWAQKLAQTWDCLVAQQSLFCRACHLRWQLRAHQHLVDHITSSHCYLPFKSQRCHQNKHSCIARGQTFGK